MKGYYQLIEDAVEKVDYRIGRSFKFPAHFHKKIEIFILLEGFYTVSRNGKTLNLKSGSIVVFDSYDIHSYDIPQTENIEGLVLIIPTNSVDKFFLRKNGKKILNDVIVNPELCKKLYDLGVSFIVSNNDEQVKNSASSLIMSLLEKELIYSQSQDDDETSFVQNLLIYINDNFKSQLSLKILSQQFGYSPEHISRVFHRYLNTSLPDYVNKLRLDFVNKTLKTENKKITELLFDAGFNSVQTYYRTKNKFKQN